MTEVKISGVYRVDCPFVREVFSRWDIDGLEQTLTWRPGVEFRPAPPYGEESDAVAHGVGEVVYRVVDIHRLPRPYPSRVFFTRQWVDPDGKAFGKANLRITTVEAFRRRLSGYRPAGHEHGWLIEDLDAEEKAALLERAA